MAKSKLEQDLGCKSYSNIKIPCDVIIKPNPFQPRQVIPKIEDLAKKIASEGYNRSFPIKVYEDNGQFYLVDGERRYKAVKYANKHDGADIKFYYADKIPKPSDADLLYIAVTSNAGQEPLHWAEIAVSYKRYRDWDWQIEDIANKFNTSSSTVSQYISTIDVLYPQTIRFYVEKCSYLPKKELDRFKDYKWSSHVKQIVVLSMITKLYGESRRLSKDASNNIFRQAFPASFPAPKPDVIISTPIGATPIITPPVKANNPVKVTTANVTPVTLNIQHNKSKPKGNSITITENNGITYETDNFPQSVKQNKSAGTTKKADQNNDLLPLDNELISLADEFSKDNPKFQFIKLGLMIAYGKADFGPNANTIFIGNDKVKV